MRAMFASRMSRSTSSAGVSSTAFDCPISGCDVATMAMRSWALVTATEAQARSLVGVPDQAQRLEIVLRPGFERRTGLEAIDEMGDDAVEARLVAAIAIIALAPLTLTQQAQLPVVERRACRAADDVQPIRRARRIAGSCHRAPHLDGRTRCRFHEDRRERLAAD